MFLTLTFASKVTSSIRDLHCHMHTIDNHCVKHEHSPSKIVRSSGYLPAMLLSLSVLIIRQCIDNHCHGRSYWWWYTQKRICLHFWTPTMGLFYPSSERSGDMHTECLWKSNSPIIYDGIICSKTHLKGLVPVNEVKEVLIHIIFNLYCPPWLRMCLIWQIVQILMRRSF